MDTEETVVVETGEESLPTIIDDLIGCECSFEFLTGQKIQGTLLGYDEDGWFLTVDCPYFGKEVLVQRRSLGLIVPV